MHAMEKDGVSKTNQDKRLQAKTFISKRQCIEAYWVERPCVEMSEERTTETGDPVRIAEESMREVPVRSWNLAWKEENA